LQASSCSTIYLVSILDCTEESSEDGSEYVEESLAPSEVPLVHTASSDKADAIERTRIGFDSICKHGNIKY
jgi:hypothetical protein